MGERWTVCLFPRMEDVARLDEFLASKLDPAYRHRLGHGGRVLIEEGLRNKDEAWKVALWVKHNCGVGNLRHMIIGYDERDRTHYLSYCPKCRAGEGPHHEHAVSPRRPPARP